MRQVLLMVLYVETYCVCGELRGVVVDVGNPDDSGGCVGQTVGGVSLHVRGLDDQGVLGDFLEADGLKKVKNWEFKLGLFSIPLFQ